MNPTQSTPAGSIPLRSPELPASNASVEVTHLTAQRILQLGPEGRGLSFPADFATRIKQAKALAEEAAPPPLQRSPQKEGHIPNTQSEATSPPPTELRATTSLEDAIEQGAPRKDDCRLPQPVLSQNAETTARLSNTTPLFPNTNSAQNPQGDCT
jgi:hypothetical protein